MTWNPALYLSFGGERTRAASDLLARVALDAPRVAIDLGCGPGNSTELLAARWPDAALTGVDSSAEMLAKARATPVPARWVQADLADWTPPPDADLLFANAVYQWVPAYLEVIARHLAALRPGAVLALQVPVNHDAPAHTAVRAIAADGPWAERLEPANIWRGAPGGPELFYRRLAPLASLDLWRTEYLHLLEGDDAVFRWLSGTALTAYLPLLEEPERAAFAAAVRARFAALYPKEPDGRTLFPFARLFAVMVRR